MVSDREVGRRTEPIRLLIVAVMPGLLLVVPTSGRVSTYSYVQSIQILTVTGAS